jgi:hypothetical protein
MPNTYTELRKTTVGTATSSVTLDLTGISGYTDLKLIGSVYGTVNDVGLKMQFNSDTGSNYSGTILLGTGSTATSARQTNISFINLYGYNYGTGSTNSIFAPVDCSIMNYSNSTTYKTTLTRSWVQRNEGQGELYANVGLWRNTNAITSINLTLTSGNFAVGTTFSLYGIAAAPIPTAKATGGTITFAADGYTYHAFTSSGTFTPSVALTCDVLQVAGGGGGGANHGGGGGAGGLLYTSSSAFSTTGFAVTVGGGGAGGTFNSSPVGASGTNSSVNSLIAIGGGRGGDYSSNYPAGNGGSGGGAGTGTDKSIGLKTTGQGFDGGSFNPNFALCGGGGGGAGAVGETCLIANSGAGGIGSAAYSQWGNSTNTGQNVSGVRYFAGGGGGGGWNGSIPVGTFALGGSGGGGNSGPVIASGASNGQAGTSNTGGGGGCGGGGTSNGGAGGSGIVIIRYASV